MRQCSRSGCYDSAAATLTYVYADATAVLGPLSAEPTPHAYDLCARHARSFSAPIGWQVVRLETEFVPAAPSSSELDELARDIKRASRRPRSTPEPPPTPARNSRNYLRVVREGATDSDERGTLEP